MAILRKRAHDNSEHQDAGQRLAHAARRVEHYRKLVATPSVLLAAGLFTLSGVAGGFLATGQALRPSQQNLLPMPPVADVQPVSAPRPIPVLEEVAAAPVVVASPEPEILDLALDIEEEALAEEEQVFTSLSIDAATGRELQRANAPALTEEQAETCRTNLQGAADRLSIRFSANSTDAAPEDLDAAFSFAEGVSTCSGLRVLVRGHADATGDETQNLLLSWERAEAVIAAIGAAGHDTAIYEPVGYGSRQLLSNTTPEDAEALNRRVEFAVVPRRQ